MAGCFLKGETMKQIVLLLALAFLLCGCVDGVGEKLPERVTEAHESLTETLPPAELVPQAPTPGQGQAVFSILENDDSIRNGAGDVLVKICYEQVVLDTSVPRWQNINDCIRGDYLRFAEEMAWLKETSVRDWESQITGMGSVYGSLLSVASAEVTNNSGGLFSVRMTRDWFLGGVFNSDHYGMTFDLDTGKPVELGELSERSREEFAAQLKQTVCDSLARDWDALSEDPALVLAEYTLEDFQFYIEGGELVLTFPTYTFGPGAMGAVTVRTGLYPELQQKK